MVYRDVTGPQLLYWKGGRIPAGIDNTPAGTHLGVSRLPTPTLRPYRMFQVAIEDKNTGGYCRVLTRKWQYQTYSGRDAVQSM